MYALSFCGAVDTKVIDSRLVSEGNHVRRRRECITCEERFTTYESAELVMPRIIKQNGIREPFNEDKLLAGLNKALEKRPVSIESVEEAVNRIKQICVRPVSVKFPPGRSVSKSPKSFANWTRLRMSALPQFTGASKIWQSSELKSTSCLKTRPDCQTTESDCPESKNRRESATLSLHSPMPPMRS